MFGVRAGRPFRAYIINFITVIIILFYLFYLFYVFYLFYLFYVFYLFYFKDHYGSLPRWIATVGSTGYGHPHRRVLVDACRRWPGPCNVYRTVFYPTLGSLAM